MTLAIGLSLQRVLGWRRQVRCALGVRRLMRHLGLRDFADYYLTTRLNYLPESTLF